MGSIDLFIFVRVFGFFMNLDRNILIFLKIIITRNIIRIFWSSLSKLIAHAFVVQKDNGKDNSFQNHHFNLHQSQQPSNYEFTKTNKNS